MARAKSSKPGPKVYFLDRFGRKHEIQPKDAKSSTTPEKPAAQTAD